MSLAKDREDETKRQVSWISLEILEKTFFILLTSRLAGRWWLAGGIKKMREQNISKRFFPSEESIKQTSKSPVFLANQVKKQTCKNGYGVSVGKRGLKQILKVLTNS